MRKLPPVKAIAHALRSVRDFAPAGIRFSLWWMAILLVIGVSTLLTKEQPQTPEQLATMSPLELISAVVSLVGFCSVAVNWHRFILRDDASGQPMRLDNTVWRYLGNSLAVLVMAVAPVLVLAVVLMLLPLAASILLVPAAFAAGTFALALSLKLPAVALGRTDFGFRQALDAARGSFWQLMGVLLLNGAIVLASTVVLSTLVSAIMAANFAVGVTFGLAMSLAFHMFYALFSVSVLSSLYGFFIEKRDF
jgi:hypothetical protein